MGKRYKMNTTTGQEEQIVEGAVDAAKTTDVVKSEAPAEALGNTMQTEEVKLQEAVQEVIKEAEQQAVIQAEATKQAEADLAPVITQTPVIDTIKQQVTENIYAKAIVGEIIAYCEDMKPGKPLGKDSYKKEQAMYNALFSLINNCPADQFAAAWKAVIEQVAKPESVALSDRYALRCASQWSLAANHYQNYQAILAILHISGLKGIEGNVRKQLDLDRVLAKFPEAARNKLISFYM